MATFKDLTEQFSSLASKQGFILESDYRNLCQGITDSALLNKVAHWLLASRLPLKKGVGQQYKEEILQRVKHPDIRNVKDTKRHTHKNKDKVQESKKDVEELSGAVDHIEGSFHLNKVIEELKDKDFKTEFLPPWKVKEDVLEGKHPLKKYLPRTSAIEKVSEERQQVFQWMNTHYDEYPTATELAEAAASMFNREDWLDDETHWVWDYAVAALDGDAAPVGLHAEEERAAGEGGVPPSQADTMTMKVNFDVSSKVIVAKIKLSAFLLDNPSVVELLHSLGITASSLGDMPYNEATIKQAIMSMVTKLGSNVYLDANQFPQAAGINFGNVAEADKLLEQLHDTTLLRDISVALDSGNYSTEYYGENTVEKTPWQQPSSVTQEVEFSEEDMNAPELQLGPKASSTQDLLDVSFHDGPSFLAAVADTPSKKAAGLEPFSKLDANYGLYFPFEEPNWVTFHMGKVKFPIDIVFLTKKPHGMEVAGIVANAQPGTHDQWSFPEISAVLEINGGTCAQKSIKEGSVCTVAEAKRTRCAMRVTFDDPAVKQA